METEDGKARVMLLMIIMMVDFISDLPGCHDVTQLVASASKVGLSLVAHDETDGARHPSRAGPSRAGGLAAGGCWYALSGGRTQLDPHRSAT